jgi:hypothetical protein
MSQIFISPFSRATTKAGLNAPGAKLYFYLTGTTTPANVYADDSRTVALSNPVVADAFAAFPSIFLDPDIAYRVRLTNSAGVLLAPEADPVRGIDAATIIEEATTAAEAQAALAAASALAASNSAAAAQVAAATSGVYANTASSNVPRGAAVNVLTAGSGGTNGTNYSATFTGGNYIGNPTILYDVVAGAVANVRLTDPGLYIGASPTAPTVVFGSGAGGAGLTLTNVFRIGNGSGYWVQSADTLTLDRYKNVAGTATADTSIQSLPTEPALAAAIASFGNIPVPINNDTLVDLVQHAWTSAPYNADGTVTITATNRTFRIDVMTPELLAARIAGTSVTFVLEVVSGSFSSVNLREYTLPNGQFGGGTATTTAMTLSAGRYSVTKTLVSTDQSIDVIFTTAGTGTVKPLGTAIGGTAARPSSDPALLTAQSLVADAGNDPSDIPYVTSNLIINAGSPTYANNTLSLPTSSNGSIDYTFPKALVDGDTGVAYFSIDVPPANIMTFSSRYDVSGGGSADLSLPEPVIEKIGPTDYRVIFQVLATTPGLIFYGLRITFNNTYAITRNVTAARFFKGATLPRIMAVPTVISDAITAATQLESDAGSLVRRSWILADSVFQSSTISFTPASVYMQQYLGVRARLKNLAVPGSGLRAMLAMAGISAAPPATGPIVTVTSNQIPAWDGTGTAPSVQITAWTGDPVTAFYRINTAISMTTYLRGQKMTLRPTAFDGNFYPTTMYLDRLEPGPMIPVPAGSQLISEQAFQMRDDFVMIEGSINGSNPSMTVLQGAAAFFAARDALSPTTHSLFMPNLIGVPLSTPVSRNTGHSDTATLVGLYGATRILDLNAAGIAGGNFLTTAEASMLATAGFSPDSTDNAYMALGWRPPSLAQADHYHPNDLCSLLIGYRVVNCSAVQSYMENLA